MKRATIVVAMVAGLSLAIGGQAGAHVSIDPGEAESDSYTKADFRVPHGCDDGDATTALTVEIPDRVVSVAPQFKEGWEVSTEEGELADPVELHGATITEGTTEVTWTVTDEPLPDDVMDEFGLSMKLPPDEAGSALYFPITQECENSSKEQAAISDAAGEDVEDPAPEIRLTAAQDDADAVEEAGAAEQDSEAAPTGAGATPSTVAAFVLGALGVVLGGSALLYARRNT